MVNTPELLGFLSPNVESPKSLLTESLVSALRPADTTNGVITYRTDPTDDFTETSLGDLRSNIATQPYLEIKECSIAGESTVNCDLHIVKYHQMWDDRAPLVHAYFHQEQLFNPDAYDRTERLVSFVETIAEELPIEFLLLTPSGPLQQEQLPKRNEYVSQVMRGAFLNVLGPAIADQFSSEQLASAPAHEVRRLENGSVLIRSTRLLSDMDGQQGKAIRAHLGIE